MILLGPPLRPSVRVGNGGTVARAQASVAAPEGATNGPASADPRPTMLPSVGDFVALLAVVLVVAALAWSVARWARKGPTSGLRAAVRKAKRLNDEMGGRDMPHPVPEMEMRRRADAAALDTRPRMTPDVDPHARASGLSGEDESAQAREAVERLALILSHPDDKDIRADYAKLDALVRRYLFDRYGVKAFSASAAALLDSLPQSLTDSVVDYAGEILRVCEVAQLRGRRPSRGELRQLCGLAYELIAGHGEAANDGDGTEIPE